MNRDPKAWARLGHALRIAREHRGLTQQELGALANVSGRSVQDAEAGTVPKARMPYTIGRIAAALGWPQGAVGAILEGRNPLHAPALGHADGTDAEAADVGPPAGWRDVPVQQQIDDEELVAGIVSNAMVRATEHTTSAEIRAATRIAVDEMRRHGLIRETNSVQPSSNSGNP